MDDIEALLVATLGGGGIHQYVLGLAEHLDDGIDASIYDMRSDPKGSGVGWLIRSIVMSLIAAVRFPFRSRPDIVHVHASQSLSFYRAVPYVLVASILWRRPVVLHIHGSSFDEFIEDGSVLRRVTQDLVFGRADRIVVLSAYWKRTLATRVDAEKLIAVPNAVAVDRYDPRYETDVPRIAFVSNLIERKGVRELVEAIESLSGSLDRPFEVRIAGTGRLTGPVRALANRCDEVEYLGYVSEAEKRSLLDGSSIFVLPTYAEGLPIALLEAMAGGNGLVTTPVGSIPEVVDDVGAVLVEPRSTTELTAALRRLLIAPPEQIADMGRHNRAIAERRYAWSVVARRVQAVYRRVLDGRPGVPDDVGQRPVVAASTADRRGDAWTRIDDPVPRTEVEERHGRAPGKGPHNETG